MSDPIEGGQAKLKYCLQLTHNAFARSDTQSGVERSFEVIRVAEQHGFDSVWVSEDPDGWDAFAILAVAARETTTIRLGTGVTNPYLRHPNLIAQSVSTIDRISGGRAFLGLGRGQPEWYRTALGMQVESPILAVEATLSLLRQWWCPPFVASDSETFHVKNWERTVSPWPAHMPPVYLAATGPKMIALAGAAADGVRFNEMASQHFLRTAVSEFHSAAKTSNRDVHSLSVIAHPGVTITADPEPELEKKKAMIALVMALPGMERQLTTPGIDVPSIMERVRWHMKTDDVLARGGGFPELRRAGNLELAKREIPLELVDSLTVVGSPEKVKRHLESLAALGITHIFLDPGKLKDGDRPLDQVLSSILPDSR